MEAQRPLRPVVSMTNDKYPGSYRGRDRRRQPPAILYESEREWLASLLESFNDKVDHLIDENKASHDAFSVRLTELERAINGTKNEPGLSENDRAMKKELSTIKKIVYWAVGALSGGTFLQIFFKGHQ